MADDKILVPFGIDQDGFKGDIDDLLKYLQSQAGKSLDGIGREIGKKGKSVIKQILIPMADGTIASVLATSTAKNKLSRGKGRIKVAGGFVEEQIGRLQSATSVKDYDDVIKKAKKEAVYLRQISAISKRFEKAKESRNRGSLDSILSSISEQKKLGLSKGFTTEGLDALNKDVEKYKTDFEKVESILERINSKSGGYFEKQKAKLDETNEKLAKAKLKLEEYVSAGKDTRDVEKEIKRLNKELSKLGKQPPLKGIQKFINTIKRVGFYRVARNLFRFIEAGFSSASKNLIEIDDGVNKTMSSLSTSAEKISSSFALVLLPALQVIEPLVTDIADSFVDFANKISEANAQMLGLSEYTKVSEKYLKDLRDTASTLSFDKFNSLSGGSKSSPYEKGSTDINKDLSKYQNFIVMIKGFASGIIETIRNVLKIIKQIFEVVSPHIDSIIKLVGNLLVILSSVVLVITDIVVKIINWLDKNGMLESTIYGILTAIMLFKGIGIITTLVKFLGLAETAFTSLGKITIQLGKLISKLFTTTAGLNTLLFVATALAGIASFKFFDSILENGPRWVSIITAIAGALATLAVTYLALTKQWAKAIALPAIAITAGLTIAGFKNSIKAYKDGGLVDAGSLFVAGEAGAELVTTMPSGQTGVTNIAQFKQAQLEALFTWWETAKYDIPDGASLSLDPADIANSKRFVSALNRKNAGLNLR